MEDYQCSPLSLAWSYCDEEEGMEELRRSVVMATQELQRTVLTAREEITKREEEVLRLKDLLTKTIKERDAAQAHCQKLLQGKLYLQQEQPQPHPHHLLLQHIQQQQQGISVADDCPATLTTAAQRPLPEKGKLLKAVMEAGPLLQTLVLAGPLPQWQRPPQIDSADIQPVTAVAAAGGPVSSNRVVRYCLSNKRGMSLALPHEGSNSSPYTKYQRVN